ncbi:MAG TPA: lipopolysaccharide biosynthesis protein RfbH, partial [Polyangiaceae bacterium]|nr:lipopolysaccharide biosynthesis protein RfbH [Polyangiaceae bacterium]
MLTRILDLVSDYHDRTHAPEPFMPGVSRVKYAGRSFDARELQAGVASVLEFWLSAGPRAAELEARFQALFGARGALLVNSGSSANLLMIAALQSETLERPLRPGDEVITPALTFPTTLTPIVQHQLVPVFVDARPGEYNIRADDVEAALSPRTRAIFVPHTLGIPCDMTALSRLARERGLFLIEDCCDAIGARWNDRGVGTFGEMASASFYPAHHMTMGEGGLVVVNEPTLVRPAMSLRDWGRDCWCGPGESNACGKRFDWQLGDLPQGYDHKYIYSELGYNLKITDVQAAIGLAQLDKLDHFVQVRQRNAAFYLRELAGLEEHLVLPVVPDAAVPSWYA